MIVGIHHNELHGALSPLCIKYEKILGYNNIDSKRMDINDKNFWNSVKQLDLFIFRWKHIDDHHQLAKTILPIIEKELGIKCFPNYVTWWHFDDKIRQYYLLKNYNFPFLDSWIYWNRKRALEWFETADLPVVFKLKGGAGSMNVIMVKTRRHGRKIIKIMFSKGISAYKIPDSSALQIKEFNLYNSIRHWGGNVLRVSRGEDAEPFWQPHKNYVYFQKFLPNNKYDTRITVIGNRAFGFRRYNREKDFRASGSGKIDYNIHEINKKCVEIAFEISQKMGFQTMAYDFLFDKDTPYICEISYTFADWAIYNCPGFWDTQLNWHEGHYWPQYCQLVDLLNLPELKQPEIKCN